MEKLFDIASYKRCVVYCPDPNTIIAEGVGGRQLRVRFRRVAVNWGVEIRVCLSGPRPEDDWAPMIHGQPLTDDLQHFWAALREKYYPAAQDAAEEFGG